VDAHLSELAGMAHEARRYLRGGLEARVRGLCRYLFHDCGFRGNVQDYYDPRNSYLNDVLERRTGLPIALSVLYMEIARRLQMPVFGIGLPRRFVIQFDDGNYSTFIDPFSGGRPITPRECFRLAEAPVADPSLLRRVNPKQIMMRMVQNLHKAYVRARDFPRAVTTLDLMIVGAPDTAPWYKHRGVLSMAAGRWQSAQRDFQKYLGMQPDAHDRDEVTENLRAIQRRIAMVN